MNGETLCRVDRTVGKKYNAQIKSIKTNETVRKGFIHFNKSSFCIMDLFTIMMRDLDIGGVAMF